jgi:hypothetical protein
MLQKQRPEISGRCFYLRIFFFLASNADVVEVEDSGFERREASVASFSTLGGGSVSIGIFCAGAHGS